MMASGGRIMLAPTVHRIMRYTIPGVHTSPSTADPLSSNLSPADVGSCSFIASLLNGELLLRRLWPNRRYPTCQAHYRFWVPPLAQQAENRCCDRSRKIKHHISSR
jgi:hypothetical protein